MMKLDVCVMYWHIVDNVNGLARYSCRLVFISFTFSFLSRLRGKSKTKTTTRIQCLITLHLLLSFYDSSGAFREFRLSRGPARAWPPSPTSMRCKELPSSCCCCWWQCSDWPFQDLLKNLILGGARALHTCHYLHKLGRLFARLKDKGIFWRTWLL